MRMFNRAHAGDEREDVGHCECMDFVCTSEVVGCISKTDRLSQI